MESFIVWVVTLHTISTVFMTGLIWFVQLAHYPLFPYAREPNWKQFILQHQMRTTAVVTPAMGMEMLSAAALLFFPSTLVGLPIRIVGILLVGVLWLSTFFLQVPVHLKLQKGFSEALCRRLVNTNWLRTVVWSIRTGIALEIVHQVGLL